MPPVQSTFEEGVSGNEGPAHLLLRAQLFRQLRFERLRILHMLLQDG
jgi:hypothetical protein